MFMSSFLLFAQDVECALVDVERVFEIDFGFVGAPALVDFLNCVEQVLFSGRLCEAVAQVDDDNALFVLGGERVGCELIHHCSFGSSSSLSSPVWYSFEKLSSSITAEVISF